MHTCKPSSSFSVAAEYFFSTEASPLTRAFLLGARVGSSFLITSRPAGSLLPTPLCRDEVCGGQQALPRGNNSRDLKAVDRRGLRVLRPKLTRSPAWEEGRAGSV